MASKQHSLQTPHSQSQSLWRDAFSNGHKWCHVQTEPDISPDSPAHDSVMSLIPFTINCVCFRVPICLWKTPDTLTQRSKEGRWRLHSSVGSLGLSHLHIFPFSFSINMKTLTIQSHSHLEKKCLLFICIKHELRVSQKLLCIFHTAVILADTVVRGCNSARTASVWAVTAVLVTACYVLLVTRSHVSIPVWADVQHHTSEHNWSLTNNYT